MEVRKLIGWSYIKPYLMKGLIFFPKQDQFNCLTIIDFQDSVQLIRGKNWDQFIYKDKNVKINWLMPL